MTTGATIGMWMSKNRWRPCVLLLLLMVLPIAFFAYSVSRVLKHQSESAALVESAQIARISATLVDQCFRQNTAFLESIATRKTFRDAWMTRDWKLLDWELRQASNLRPDCVFLSVYDLDGTMGAMYPRKADVLDRNFAYRDWFRGVTANRKPYVSSVFQTDVEPRPLVAAIVVPIEDYAGKPVGIIMAP